MRFLPLSCSLLLSAIAAGAANAQSSNAQSSGEDTEIAAKFTCGAAIQDADVVKGVFATSINIHNPQKKEVVFNKKIVVANPEGQLVKPIRTRTDRLPPDQAERVDCPVIFKILGITNLTTHVEGFVVLDVKQDGRSQRRNLDVVGKYTARPSSGEVSSIDVVVFSPKERER